MPRNMGKLTCLKRLDGLFEVGGADEGKCSSWNEWFYGLEDLKLLNNLRDYLDIRIRWPKSDVKVVKEDSSRREGLYLKWKEHIHGIGLIFSDEEDVVRMDDKRTLSLMEDLQPHSNLKHLVVGNYLGVKLPGWVSYLPNLKQLDLHGCQRLKYLPCLGNLPHLEKLVLMNLENLEYIEEEAEEESPSLANSFFPSLERLELKYLPDLKGWRRARGVVRVEDTIPITSSSSSKPQLQPLIPCFSQLKMLHINYCKELTCIPPCPTVEELDIFDFNEGLRIIGVGSKLRKLRTSNATCFESIESFQCLEYIRIWNEKIVDLPNWMQYCIALQTLDINGCRKLKAVPNWMSKLTSLKNLNIEYCSRSLERRCQKDPPGEDWPYIQHIPNIELSRNDDD